MDSPLAYQMLLKKYSYIWEFAAFIKVNPEILLNLLSNQNTWYHHFSIPKASGGTRSIAAPCANLSIVQEAILEHILRPAAIQPSHVAHGGVPERSIITNAWPHIISESQVSLDLLEAFDRTSLSNFFTVENKELFNLPRDTDFELMQMFCEYEGHLPQGAHTSPHLFNIASRAMHDTLQELVSRYMGIVTAYVDNIDITFFDTTVPKGFLTKAITVIQNHGFTVNSQKVHTYHHANTENQPIRLPGVRIIDERLVLPRKTIEDFRYLLFVAGLSNNLPLYQGIAGHISAVYPEKWPRQLRGQFEKGQARATTLISQALAGSSQLSLFGFSR